VADRALLGQNAFEQHVAGVRVHATLVPGVHLVAEPADQPEADHPLNAVPVPAPETADLVGGPNQRVVHHLAGIEPDGSRLLALALALRPRLGRSRAARLAVGRDRWRGGRSGLQGSPASGLAVSVRALRLRGLRAALFGSSSLSTLGDLGCFFLGHAPPLYHRLPRR